MSDILSERYVVSILKFMTRKDTYMKSELSEVVSNPYFLESILKRLEAEDYISMKVSQVGRKKYEISLTEKGRRVALTLTEVQKAGEKEEPQKVYDMPVDWRDRFKGLSAMTHLNVLDDHVALQQIDHRGKITKVIFVYVKRINSHFQLWCEEDQSYDCVHVDFAWSLPAVRELVEQYIKEGKIKKEE